MQHFDADATRARLPLATLIERLRERFASGCETPLRQTHTIANAKGDADAGIVLVMPAWRAGAYFGLKTITIFPNNAALGLPALHALYQLFDARTGVPLASIDGGVLTARRTAAASALAAGHLARRDARCLLIVGAGRIASLLPEAMRCVRPGLQEVLVWNRSLPAAQALATACGGRVASELQAAVQRADIISCATLATAPLVQGAWLAPGCHLDLIGSFTPTMCEADANAVQRARVFVDTEEALTKAGELLQAGFDASALQGTLAELCRGKREGRCSEAEITLFKGVGTALEDLAAAECVWAAARG